MLSLASMHVSAIVQYHKLGQLVAVINMYHDFVVHSTGTYISGVYYFELGVLYLPHSVSTCILFCVYIRIASSCIIFYEELRS